MIIFADDHEAELWRAIYRDHRAWLRSCAKVTAKSAELATLAAKEADAAVLEYSKRCAHPTKKPNINPGCIWCDPSFKCWSSAEPCLKVAKCSPEVPR